MKHTTNYWLLLALALLFAINLRGSQAMAQGTAFTYQGQLTSGNGPANGSYDLQFALYNVGSNGIAVAEPLTNSAIILSNGLFSVVLDFGSGLFTGTNYWLEIGARTNGGNAFTILAPRQQLTPVPYAITAANGAQDDF